MGRSDSSSLSSSLLHFLLSVTPLFLLSTSEQTAAFIDVSLENQIVHVVPSPHAGYFCERVRVSGTSRLNLKSYANSLRVTVKASDAIPEKLHGKIEVCPHRNVSLGLCQCGDDECKTLQKGQWSDVISPYETRYIDVKFKDKISGSIAVSVEEEFQQWRLVCLGFGFLLLLLAPIVSTWVPFYYSSSMALGCLLVVLLILFQGMKLLPMGRKNILYITVYGSVLGVGSYIAHYFSTVVNSILVGFGLSEEMHNPVSIFLLVGIILAGAALGYWIVRKYVLSEDGSIDDGIAQFVKWAMRVIAVVFVLQSSRDSLLSVVALGICWCICSLVTSKKLWSQSRLQQRHSRSENLWARKTSASSKHAEFLSRSAKKYLGRSVWRSPSSPYAQSNSHIKAHTYSSPNKNLVRQQESYYSSFHKMPARKFSKTDWEDFTRESTREALAEWASSPEVTKWIADNAHCLRLDPDHSPDDNLESSSGSSEETVVENGSGLGLFKWY